MTAPCMTLSPASSSQTPPCRGQRRAARSPGATMPLLGGQSQAFYRGVAHPAAGFMACLAIACPDAGYHSQAMSWVSPRAPLPASDLSATHRVNGACSVGTADGLGSASRGARGTPRQPPLAGNRNGLGIPRPRRKGWEFPAAGCLPDAATRRNPLAVGRASAMRGQAVPPASNPSRHAGGFRRRSGSAAWREGVVFARAQAGGVSSTHQLRPQREPGAAFSVGGETCSTPQ